jgi:hypothetical protein
MHNARQPGTLQRVHRWPRSQGFPVRSQRNTLPAGTYALLSVPETNNRLVDMGMVRGMRYNHHVHPSRSELPTPKAAAFLILRLTG